MLLQPTDAELLLSCRRGEETAWETLIHRYQRLIYAIPRRAGLDDDQAAEVFQEVFTTLFQKLDQIEEPEKIHAWLVTTARRKTGRLLAKARQWRQPDTSDENDAELMKIPDQAELPDAVMVVLEEQHRVRTAVQSLDQRCRQLLEMLFYQAEAPSYAEIATTLGTNEGSIGPTRARCLQKLLRLLKD